MNRVGYHGTHETQPSRMVYLDSVDCTQFTELTSHYSFSFKDAVETASDEGMLVSLSSVSIPYSFYNIRLGVNDKLYYNSTHLQITPGNYSANSLKSEIVGKFSASGITMTIDYDKITQKFKFTTSDSVTFKFDEDDALKNEIGFGSSTDPVTITATTSPQVADLNGSVHAIYIRTNLATKSVMESQTGGVSDILAKVDINTDPGGVITLDPQQTSHESLIHTAGVKHIEIRITDERNRLLDLNGLHSQVALKFRFVNIKVSEPVQQVDTRVRVNPKDVEAQQQHQPKPHQKVKPKTTRKPTKKKTKP